MTARKKATKTAKLNDRIVDQSLAMADEQGWGGVRLREVAAALGVSMTEVQGQFRDLDAVSDAWFRRADEAMLAPVDGDFWNLPARERLYLLVMRWFDALGPHRRVTGQMLALKMYPFHPHHWAPAVFNLSRLIHWLRDAAHLDAAGPRRQMEEIGLTVLFLATLACWLTDESEGQEATRRFLARRLRRADRAMACFGNGASLGNFTAS